jgi:hypothetical protein
MVFDSHLCPVVGGDESSQDRGKDDFLIHSFRANVSTVINTRVFIVRLCV